MNEKIHNDELTHAIHRAVWNLAIEEGISHNFRLLGEIICKGDRTAENRLADGGWEFDEVVKIVRATRNEQLISIITNQFKGEL